MSWIDKLKAGIGGKKTAKDEDLWVGCKKCKEQIYISELEKNLKVCPHCDYHFRLETRQRIHQLIDPESFKERDQLLTSSDPLKFKDTKKNIKIGLNHRLKKGFLTTLSSLALEHWKVCQLNSASSTSVSWGEAWGRWWEKKLPVQLNVL
jgi:hypothetical protein